MIKRVAAAFGIMLGCTGCLSAAEQANVPQEYIFWLDELKKEMSVRGISAQTINRVFAENYYHPAPEVVKVDRNQNEFVLTFANYTNRVVTARRVDEARQKYKELHPVFRQLEKDKGVPFNYLIAFWGMESNFGRYFGNYRVVEALTMLSYDKRRSKFFREELYQALKIIDQWGIDYQQMEGSWAGAMGHFQFMPSTFNAYAIDYNQDGQIDIWHSFEDAAGSAANYLQKAGWKAGQPWGTEVLLPWDFDFSQTGRGKVKTIAEWSKLGVKTMAGSKLPFASDSEWSIIVPEGRKGKAFIVGHNFRVIMKWNRSENYALAVGMLADYTVSSARWRPVEPAPNIPITTKDVTKIQSFINKSGYVCLDEDGQLGSKTREAIQKLQQRVGIQPDGYPDYRLLNKIEKYNSETGFAIPLPPRKLHRQK